LHCVLVGSLHSLIIAKPLALQFNIPIYYYKDKPKCDYYYVVGNYSEIPIEYDRLPGIRFYNSLGIFYFFAKYNVSSIVYPKEDVWHSSFTEKPVILKETFTTFILPTKVNFNPYFLTRGRFTYLLRLKVPTNMQNYIMTHTFFFNELYAIMGWTYIPPIFKKIEEKVLKKYNYSLKGYIIVANLFRVLYHYGYYALFNEYTKIING